MLHDSQTMLRWTPEYFGRLLVRRG